MMPADPVNKAVKEYLRLYGWHPRYNNKKRPEKSIDERAKEAGIDLEYHLRED